MTRINRIMKDLRGITKEEREAVSEAMRRAALLRDGAEEITTAILHIVFASARAGRRRASDRQTDARRRRLVGARVPVEMAERCRLAAEERGISLYRFVVEALAAALDGP